MKKMYYEISMTNKLKTIHIYLHVSTFFVHIEINIEIHFP